MKPEDIAYLSALFASNKKKVSNEPIEVKVEVEVEPTPTPTPTPTPEKKNRKPIKKKV